MRSRSSSMSKESTISVVGQSTPPRDTTPFAQRLHFDIDRHLNPFIPCPPTSILPYPVLYFLGYRQASPPPKDVGNVLIALSTLFTTFIGLLTLTSLYKFAPLIADTHPPVLIGSLVSHLVYKYTLLTHSGRIRHPPLHIHHLTTRSTPSRTPRPCPLRNNRRSTSTIYLV
jgi:hypothetical protein